MCATEKVRHLSLPPLSLLTLCPVDLEALAEISLYECISRW